MRKTTDLLGSSKLGLGVGGHARASVMRNNEPEIIKSRFKDLTNSKSQEFPVRGGCNAPDRRGVYVIYSPKGKVLHVGRTPSARGGIAQRLGNHMSGASSFFEKCLMPNGFTLRHGSPFRLFVLE